MKIGVVSDTHGYFDPRLRAAFQDAAAILHGGDVGSQDVLDELQRIAPVFAVRGNVDSPDLNLPLSLKTSLGGLHIEMVHILPVPQSELEEWEKRAASPDGKPPHASEAFLKTFDDSTGLVVFGHSHQPCLVTLGRRLFFNPGSAGKQRFRLPRCYGLLEISANGIHASIERLGAYDERLPASVWLDFDE